MPSLDLERITVRPGLDLEVARRGHGPAMLLLHGYTDSWRSFEPVLERLPADVTALAVSQRGHGDSGRPVAGYSMAGFAADAAALLDRLQLADVMVVGHSMGSLVAQELALIRPERVSRLVLAGTAASFDQPVVRELAAAVAALEDPIPHEFVWDFQASTVHRPISQAMLATAVSESLKVPARIWREALRGQLVYDAGERLAHLRMPTRIVWGDRDAICPRSQQDRLVERIPAAQLSIYEGTGHALHWEQPQRFADELVTFLRGDVGHITRFERQA